MFLCNHNSCRSQIADGWLRALRSSDVGVASSGIVGESARSPCVLLKYSCKPCFLCPKHEQSCHHLLTLCFFHQVRLLHHSPTRRGLLKPSYILDAERPKF